MSLGAQSQLQRTQILLTLLQPIHFFTARTLKKNWVSWNRRWVEGLTLIQGCGGGWRTTFVKWCERTVSALLVLEESGNTR